MLLDGPTVGSILGDDDNEGISVGIKLGSLELVGKIDGPAEGASSPRFDSDGKIDGAADGASSPLRSLGMGLGTGVRSVHVKLCALNRT